MQKLWFVLNPIPESNCKNEYYKEDLPFEIIPFIKKNDHRFTWPVGAPEWVININPIKNDME